MKNRCKAGREKVALQVIIVIDSVYRGFKKKKNKKSLDLFIFFFDLVSDTELFLVNKIIIIIGLPKIQD